MFSRSQNTDEEHSKAVVALNASYRGKRGYTYFLLQKICAGVVEAGGNCEILNLVEYKIKRCVACNVCHTAENFLHCTHETRDDVLTIFNKMREADIVIYGTPVYVFNISALLKMLLERMYAISDTHDLRLSKSGYVFHHVDKQVCSKPFVSVVTCDSLEYAMPSVAQQYFRQFSRFMDAPQIGGLVRNGGYISGYGQDTRKMGQFPRLRQVYAAYRQAGRELVHTEHISRRTMRRANQEIIPLPLFGLLKRLRFFKPKILTKARAYMDKDPE